MLEEDAESQHDFELFQRRRRELLERLLTLMESREQPGKIDDSIESLLKILTAPDAQANIEELARFARSSRYVRSVWLWVTGGVMMIGSFIIFGRDLMEALKSFLEYYLKTHPAH